MRTNTGDSSYMKESLYMSVLSEGGGNEVSAYGRFLL